MEREQTIQMLHRASLRLVQGDATRSPLLVSGATVDAERILMQAIRDIRVERVCAGPEHERGNEMKHKQTKFTFRMFDDSGEIYSDTSIEVDEPDSLGQWVLEHGDYHQRNPYCLEITHVNEISGCIATAHKIVP